MQSRSGIRGFQIQIIVVSLLTIGFYLILAKLDTPNFSLWELIKGVIKFLLGPFGFFSRIPKYIWTVFYDIGLFILSFLGAIVFFAQFSLPVNNSVQRALAGLYLLGYSLHLHGPAVRIQNGKLPTDRPRRDPHGRGVLILDTASAALLRRRAEFTRSVGPGLVFTRRGEYIAGAVDLHRIAWPSPPGFGPRGESEDPFATRDESIETPEEFEHRQKRRYETSGETRDGVEVVPNIFVFSQIDPNSDQKNDNNLSSVDAGFRRWLIRYMSTDHYTRFGYNSEAVRLAVTGELVDPKVPMEDVDKRKLPWYQLPVYLAVDLWREYLRKFTFEELFTEHPEFSNKTALQVIQEKVAERLKQPTVEEISPIGKPGGRASSSYEFLLLQSRGIKVLYAPIRNLHFQKQVDQQLEDKWFAYWRWRADDEREYVDRLRSYHLHEGEMEALRDFSHYTTLRFDKDFIDLKGPNTAEERQEQMRLALELIVRGTLRQCVSDSLLHPRLAGEESQLVAIINWLRRQKVQ